MNFIILIHVNGGKRIRSSLNGNLGLTPPIKTRNMAATSPVQSQPVFLQVLSQAMATAGHVDSGKIRRLG
jgi:hypothetical protein